MELAVRICVLALIGQKEIIKSRSRFKCMRGQYIGQRYGQVLLQGTIRLAPMTLRIHSFMIATLNFLWHHVIN